MCEILVAVTFRDFNGDANSQLQRAFLEGIKNQTHKNFKLVVTNYRERLVEQELRKWGLPFILHQSGRDCQWSWSEVIANTFPHLQKGRSIILWTNALVIFDSNFFEEIIRNFRPGIGGTSYPPLHYYSLEDFRRQRMVDPYHNREIRTFYEIDPNIIVPEAMYVDGDLLLDKRNQELFLAHMVDGHAPGIAVTLMFGMFGSPIINLIHKARIHRIKRAVSGEKPQSLHDKNYAIMLEFCRRRALDKKYYTNHRLRSRKLSMHREYRLIGNLWQRLLYETYFFYYTVRPRRSFIVTGPKLRRLASEVLELYPALRRVGRRLIQPWMH